MVSIVATWGSERGRVREKRKNCGFVHFLRQNYTHIALTHNMCEMRNANFIYYISIKHIPFICFHAMRVFYMMLCALCVNRIHKAKIAFSWAYHFQSFALSPTRTLIYWQSFSFIIRFNWIHIPIYIQKPLFTAINFIFSVFGYKHSVCAGPASGKKRNKRREKL